MNSLSHKNRPGAALRRGAEMESFGFFRLDDHGQEHGFLRAHGLHAVRELGVEVDGVALIQRDLLAVDLHPQAALEHVVELLPHVGVEHQGRSGGHGAGRTRAA